LPPNPALQFFGHASFKADSHKSAPVDFKAFAIIPSHKALGLRIADDLLLSRIPLNLPIQSGGDTGQMAGRQRSMMAEDIRNRLDAIANGLKKVSEMVG
jgi:hypothetical protein